MRQAAFVTFPSGRIFDLTSPDATRDELPAMVQSPPIPVPYVSSGN